MSHSFLLAIKSRVEFNNASLLVDIEDVGCLTRLSRIAELLTLRIGVAALFTAIGAGGGGFLFVVSALFGLVSLLGSCFSLCLEDFGGFLHALHDVSQRLLDAACFRAFSTFVI